MRKKVLRQSQARKVGARACALALMVLLCACATVQRGTSETFVVRTSPDGAIASSSRGWKCTTPCEVEIPRRGDFVVALRKEGYVTQTISVRSLPVAQRPSRVTASTGMLGSLVDSASGANYEHRPNPLTVTLERER